MGATLTSVFPTYKEHYLGNLPEIFFTSKKLTSPVLAQMESKSLDDGGGRGFVVPTVFRLPGAISPSFTTAQTKARGSATGSTFGTERWVVQPVELNAPAVFTRESILAAKGDSDKLLDVVKMSMESTTMGLRKRYAHYASGAGWAKVATVLAVTTTTVTIDNDLCNLVQEGDDLVAAATESASVLKAITSGPETTITAINRATGVLTVDQDPTAGTPWVVGDTIFRFGEREDSATPTRLVVTGLDGWFGTDTVLHGVTRTGKADLTAHQIDGASKDIGQAIVEAMRTLFQYDSYASVCYVSPTDFETVSLDRDAAKTISMDVGSYKIAFEGLNASWNGYTVKLLPDAMIQPGRAYLGPFDDGDVAPFLACNGDLVNVDNEDGMDIRAIDAAASYEARLFSRGNFITPGPGKFARITGLGT